MGLQLISHRDWNLARESVQHLASLDPLVWAMGQPLAGPNIPAAMRELAARFDDIAPITAISRRLNPVKLVTSTRTKQLLNLLVVSSLVSVACSPTSLNSLLTVTISTTKPSLRKPYIESRLMSFGTRNSTPDHVASAVEKIVKIFATGGFWMDKKGKLYSSDVTQNAVCDVR